MSARKLFNPSVSTLIEIDETTILPQRPLVDLIGQNHIGSTLHISETFVDLKQHRLSQLPSDRQERAIYENRQVRAPEMVLERLKDCYWVPELGFLISKDGKVWRHSTLGQYFDPNFVTFGGVEERLFLGAPTQYIFHEKLLSDAPVIKGLHILTSHYASMNYGHYLLDMVPLMSVAQEHNIKMLTRSLLPWHRSIYSAMNIDMNQVDVIEGAGIVFLEDVIVSNRHNAHSTHCTHPQHRVVFNKMSETVVRERADHSNPTPQNPKLFLMRKDGPTRSLKNRKKLAKALSRSGFSCVYPDDFSFEEQVVMMSQAGIVVSEFGALLANVAFCKPATIVVEIIPEGQFDPWSAHMCAALELEHVVLFQKVKDKDRVHKKVGGRTHANISFQFDVDIDRVLETLEKLTAQSALS